MDALIGWTWRLMQGWHGECGRWRLFATARETYTKLKCDAVAAEMQLRVVFNEERKNNQGMRSAKTSLF